MFASVHHAYLLVGERESGYKEFLKFIEKLDFRLDNNPDFFSFNSDLFGIEEARELGRRAATKPFGEKKIFLVSPQRFTLESQNALLKLLEEPAENTHFFIVIRERETILPTLISRVRVIDLKEARGGKEAKRFLEMGMKERISFAKEFSDNEEDLALFLDKLLVEMKERGSDIRQMEKLFRIRKFAEDRSVMRRLLLEHLALVI